MAVPLDALWLPALFVILVGTIVSVRLIRLSLPVALLLAFVKASMPFVYFGYYGNRAWHLWDDMRYYEVGHLLLAKGNNPFLILFTVDGRGQLFSMAGGYHILYYWWNLLAVYLFGPYYCSPVFLNVAMTFVSGALICRIAGVTGCSERYARYLGVFFLLQWDLLAWSSLVNLKDTLVLLLTVAAIYFGIQLGQRREIRYLLLLAVPLYTLLWIRFYIPILLLVALLFWTALTLQGRQRFFLVCFAAASAFMVLYMNATEPIIRRYLRADWVYGIVRFIFTPLPWSISPEYSFLTVPSILHEVMVVPAIIACIRLAHNNARFRFAALYLLVIILFYGHVPPRQGPRERMQICWVLAWGEFECLWHLARSVLRRRPHPEVAPYKNYAVRAPLQI
jgi:hypothetical protein